MKIVTIVSIIVITIICVPSLFSAPINEELDQQQIDYDATTCLHGNMLFAQSFTPEVDTLTKVELIMNKMGDLFGNSVLSIRESLTSFDLTLVIKESIEIDGDLSWITFDVPDIDVIPGETYYIVLTPDPNADGGEEHYLSWGFSWDDSYADGSAYWQYEGSWNQGVPSHRTADYTFKTYGIKDDSDEEVELDITAGGFGRNMGFGVAIDVYNYESEEILIEYSITRDRFFIKDLPETYTNNFTVPPEAFWMAKIGVGNEFLIYNLEISAWYDDNKITKTGISIGEFVILNS